MALVRLCWRQAGFSVQGLRILIDFASFQHLFSEGAPEGAQLSAARDNSGLIQSPTEKYGLWGTG